MRRAASHAAAIASSSAALAAVSARSEKRLRADPGQRAANIGLKNHHQDDDERTEEIVQQPVEREQPENLRGDEREANHHHPHHHLHRARAANQQRDAVDRHRRRSGCPRRPAIALPATAADNSCIEFCRPWATLANRRRHRHHRPRRARVMHPHDRGAVRDRNRIDGGGPKQYRARHAPAIFRTKRLARRAYQYRIAQRANARQGFQSTQDCGARSWRSRFPDRG